MRPEPKPAPALGAGPPYGSTSGGITWRAGKPHGLDQPVEVKGGLSTLVLDRRR